MPRAAAMPSATASTTSLPPFMQSPPAKYFRLPVWCPAPATTVPFLRSSIPCTARRNSVTGFCPTARTTMSTSIVKWLSGTASGVRRPRASGAPSRRADAFQARHRAALAEDAHRLRLPHKDHFVVFRQLMFVGKRRHFLLASPVNQIYRFRAQTPRGGDYVDRRIPRADAGDAFRRWRHARTASLSCVR